MVATPTQPFVDGTDGKYGAVFAIAQRHQRRFGAGQDAGVRLFQALLFGCFLQAGQKVFVKRAAGLGLAFQLADHHLVLRLLKRQVFQRPHFRLDFLFFLF